MSDEDNDKLERITELMVPIDEQITKCVTGNEQIMLACGMMQRVKEILEHHLGAGETAKILKEYVNEQHVH
jgi:hypothetical protein